MYFLYTGRLRPEGQITEAKDLVELYELANMHMIPELGEEVAKVVASLLNENNWFEMAIFAELYGIDTIMRSIARYMISNSRKISGQWPSNCNQNHGYENVAKIYERLILSIIDELGK